MLEDQPPGSGKPEVREASAPGAYVTIRSGGPLEGVVTISATGTEGRVIVEAAWGRRYARSSLSVERTGHAAANALAHHWADELAAGREPRTG